MPHQPILNATSQDDRTERAQRAVAAFRKMQNGLTAYARAITGDRKVRVQIKAGVPHTDGTVIYYQPPLALGDNTPHDRYMCGDREPETGLLACPACRVREEVLVNIYHEIAHIAFGTFADNISKTQLKQMNPYLPELWNSLEDARVDAAMFEVRRGTRKMMVADTLNILREGVEDRQGNKHTIRDAPLNSQMGLAVYLQAAHYDNWQDLIHPKVVQDIDDAQLTALLSEVSDAQTSSEVLDISKRVLARLREMGYYLTGEEQDEQKQQEEESDDSGGDGAPEQQDREPEEEAESDSSGSGEDQAGDSEDDQDAEDDSQAAQGREWDD